MAVAPATKGISVVSLAPGFISTDMRRSCWTVRRVTRDL